MYKLNNNNNNKSPKAPRTRYLQQPPGCLPWRARNAGDDGTCHDWLFAVYPKRPSWAMEQKRPAVARPAQPCPGLPSLLLGRVKGARLALVRHHDYQEEEERRRGARCPPQRRERRRRRVSRRFLDVMPLPTTSQSGGLPSLPSPLCACANWSFGFVPGRCLVAAHGSKGSRSPGVSSSRLLPPSCSNQLTPTLPLHLTLLSWHFLSHPSKQLPLRAHATPTARLTQPSRYAESEGSNFDSADSDEEEPPPKKKAKRTSKAKSKDEDEDESEEEEAELSAEDDEDVASDEVDDEDDEDEDDKKKAKDAKPAGAEKDRKVKKTGKDEPVPVVDDDDEE
ncbi:hypothetical protein COCMIDRAFT_22192 [Bipolaris oryzae ATCC 44560]|uniref:Uncharacterized protein n=1 Tax=Bipolaris oryzae ATCC 44560 TaxID=930090 RepID=W6ZER5_COCMI|nr:uncharacterized protein COCMIDRAFT_22192 [Bipolaris oryzae ATCC 44560]EUC50317.1 hypothetical protein COCMIDRAFT_22192 [Bipolaris oryzae ATCC 44560]